MTNPKEVRRIGWHTKKEKQELFEALEKEIDAVKSRRIFKHICRKEEFNDVDVPLIHMPKTLTSLISVGYASHLAPIGHSDSSSQSSNNSTLEDWSDFFGEDARLCFNRIFSYFTSSSDMNIRELYVYRQSLCHAHFAVLSYNEHHGAEYELVAPIVSYIFPSRELGFISYVNFFAKPKNSESSPDLFFAKMVACGYQANEVLECCILEPRPSPVAMTFDFVTFWLPPGEHPDPCSLKFGGYI
ncbi:uncharacterized protein LOC141706231 isoform X1 [Apium graveolens]|uniref:uncharacterized protein LOC141706231 isoform X1 n=1 Tax=Apium graveolens TaxID=4045 RepID=UPI003D7AE5AB